VRSDWAHVLGAADVIKGAFGSTDLLFDGPSQALSSGRSFTLSTGAEATLDAQEVDPSPMGPCREEREESHGIVLRPGVIVAAVIALLL
jgi:hypothetical protein